MDLIGLVKDSFEAVVQEVESAYQRGSSETQQHNGESKDSSKHNSTQTVEGAVGEDDAAASVQQEEGTDMLDGGQTQETSTLTVVDETTSNNGESAEAADLQQQFHLLADVMQQAASQLSSAADNGSFESDNDATAKSLDDLRQEHADMRKEQADMRKLFESRIHSDEVQSRTLERLHGELQESRKQIQRAEMAPLLKDIIFCHDFVTREFEREGEVDFRKGMEMMEQMLLDVLFKYDVEPFRSESDEFDRSNQQCVKTEATDDEAQDRRIATRGLTGFRGEDRIIRREQVTVLRYRAS